MYLRKVEVWCLYSSWWEPRSLESGDFSLWRRSDTRVSEIIVCLSIWGRYESVVGLSCVISKMFPCVNFCKGQVRRCWTHRLSILPVSLPFGRWTFFLVGIQCGLVAFYAIILVLPSSLEGSTDLKVMSVSLVWCVLVRVKNPYQLPPTPWLRQFQLTGILWVFMVINCKFYRRECH